MRRWRFSARTSPDRLLNVEDNTLAPGTGAPDVVIIGAGPAGLTAAYQLTKRGVSSTVLEADRVVGGISRTAERDGWRFDIGGHRFFTKVQAVEDLWHEILPDEDFLLRPRMSRIFYRGKYYDYPLKPLNALGNLGFIEAVRCMLSYAWARVRPPKDQRFLEGWISARFGKRLYEHFFKSYNEKLWGRPAAEISADFAAQRIKNLTILNAITTAMKPRRKQTDITSLIEEFQYPKYGPGMMWERARELVEAAGTKVVMESPVSAIHHDGGLARSVTAGGDGAETTYGCDHVISSMPLPLLVKAMRPPVPERVHQAADGLSFRDFLTIALVVPERYSFPDNWIYVHDPQVKVGRIQNFGSWSPYLVKEGRTCLGLEYFVFEGDETWTTPDDELVELGKRELAKLGLVDAVHVEAGYVVRMPKAYPVYDEQLQGQRRRDARLAGRAHAQRAPGRSQRHAQVQQPGPLDVHGHAHRREPVRRRTTTSGPSTSKRSTTRSSRRVDRPGDAQERSAHRRRNASEREALDGRQRHGNTIDDGRCPLQSEGWSRASYPPLEPHGRNEPGEHVAQDLGFEAGSGQLASEESAVVAPVVPECDIRRAPQPSVGRHVDDEPSPASQHSASLGESRLRLGQVLDHVEQADHLGRVVGEGQRSDEGARRRRGRNRAGRGARAARFLRARAPVPGPSRAWS